MGAVSRSSDHKLYHLKPFGVLAIALIVVGGIVIVFLGFCLLELFISIFTGGVFSWVFPSLATVMVILTFIALAIVRGGSCE